MMTSRKRTFEEFSTSQSFRFLKIPIQPEPIYSIVFLHRLHRQPLLPAVVTISTTHPWMIVHVVKTVSETKHSEIHTTTIEMMMNAQLQLQRQEKLQRQQQQHSSNKKK